MLLRSPGINAPHLTITLPHFARVELAPIIILLLLSPPTSCSERARVAEHPSRGGTQPFVMRGPCFADEAMIEIWGGGGGLLATHYLWS